MIQTSHVIRKDCPFYVVRRNDTFWEDTNWERFTYDTVQKHSNINKVFIDIGAWIGPISLYAARLNKICYSFEPDPVARSEFETNIKLNNIDNIIVSPEAISNSTGTINIGNDNSFGNSNTRITSNVNSIQVKCITFSDVLKNGGGDITDISMIKIDVEGAEVNVLSDPLLYSCGLPIHLSIHPPFMSNVNNELEFIYKFVRQYKNIQTDNGIIASSIDNILHYREFYSLALWNV